jgi:hypothetical protein
MQLAGGITHELLKRTIAELNHARGIDAKNGIGALFKHISQCVHPDILHSMSTIGTSLVFLLYARACVTAAPMSMCDVKFCYHLNDF